MNNRFLLLITLMLLSACSSHQAKEQFNFLPDISAKLQKTDDGYKFIEFSAGRHSRFGEPWVHLKTGQPLWSASDTHCNMGWMNVKHAPECENVVDESLFIESEFDATDQFARVIAATFTFGLSLTGSTQEVAFNKEDYDEAYSDAMRGLNEAALREVDSLYAKLKEKQRHYSNIYSFSANSTRSKDLQFEVTDLSGFYNNQINFTKNVSIKKNKLRPIPQIDSKSLPELIDNIVATTQKLDDDWKRSSSSVRASCRASSEKNFDFHLLCPYNLKVSDGKVVGTIPVTVTGMSADRLIVETFSISDENIALRLKGSKIGLSNKTDKFISIESISFYYGDLISTPANLLVELSPHAKLLEKNKIDLHRDFTIDWKELKYEKLTKKRSQSETIDFGFAVKYRVHETNNNKTLYDTKTYTISQLL